MHSIEIASGKSLLHHGVLHTNYCLTLHTLLITTDEVNENTVLHKQYWRQNLFRRQPA